MSRPEYYANLNKRLMGGLAKITVPEEKEDEAEPMDIDLITTKPLTEGIIQYCPAQQITCLKYMGNRNAPQDQKVKKM